MSLDPLFALYLDPPATDANQGRRVYRVFRLGTDQAVGAVAPTDDGWRITAAPDAGPWGDPHDAARHLMTTTPKEL